MNILTVDDSKIFLEALGALIEKLVPRSEISMAFNGMHAIAMLDETKPDLMILDVNMPLMNGLEVAKYTRQKYPQTKIIILTNVDGKAMVLNLSKYAHGILFKDIGSTDLKNCIEAVLSGQKYFCENSKKLILDNTYTLTDLPDVNLNVREINIVKLLAAGRTSKEISKTLGIRERTIQSYREDLLKKTKTENTPELVMFAVNNSLISVKQVI